MSAFKNINLIIYIAIIALMGGCNSDDDSGSDTAQNRISTYEFHITGGTLDGQTFSGSFPNNRDRGLSQFIEKEGLQIENDVVQIKFSDTTDQGKPIVFQAILLVDDNGNILPNLGEISDVYIKSTISFIVPEGVMVSSNSGTVSLSNLKKEKNVKDFIAPPIDCNSSFEGEFSALVDPLQGMETVNVTGEVHIKSIRE